jgi:hypothetical protein
VSKGDRNPRSKALTGVPEDEPQDGEFEELVAAALKVSPEGLSGKHRKSSKKENRP